jgi:hypothetical protein
MSVGLYSNLTYQIKIKKYLKEFYICRLWNLYLGLRLLLQPYWF